MIHIGILAGALFLIASSCSSPSRFYQSPHNQAAAILHKNDQAFAKKGLYEFMTVMPPQPLIGSFKKHYITKTHLLSDVDEARVFFCAFLEALVDPLNQEKSLRPYLQNYPMSFEDVDLQIVFVDDEDRPRLAPHFCSLRKVGETIYYEHYDPVTKRSVASAIERADRACRIYSAHKMTGKKADSIGVQIE